MIVDSFKRIVTTSEMFFRMNFLFTKSKITYFRGDNLKVQKHNFSDSVWLIPEVPMTAGCPAILWKPGRSCICLPVGPAARPTNYCALGSKVI